MIAGGMAGLSLIILGLSGTIAFELMDQNPPPAGLFAGVVHPVHAGARSRATLQQGNIDGRLSEILARPIFSPDRRPIGVGTRSVAGLSRLTGIVITDSRKLAIFAAPSGGQPVVAEEGSHINAYEVKTISDSGVTIVGPAGAMVMSPIFDPTPPVPKGLALARQVLPQAPRK